MKKLRVCRGLIFIVIAILAWPITANAVIIVNGQGPDESNHRPGIQNTKGTWTDAAGNVHPDPPDSCVNPAHPRYKHFRTLQAALYAIDQGWFGSDRLIRIATALPLKGNEPQVPQGVSSSITINNPLQIEPGPTIRPIIDGGSNVITVNSWGVVLIGLEIRNGTRNGIFLYSSSSGTATRGLELTDVLIHNNRNGLYVSGSNDYYPISIVDSEIRDNQINGIYVVASRTDISIQKANKPFTRINNNQGGYGIYIEGKGVGTGVRTASLNLSFAEIKNNGYDGVRTENGVRFMMEDSEIKENGYLGIRVDSTPPFPPLSSPVIRRSKIKDNKQGGVKLSNIRQFLSKISQTEITNNTDFGLFLDNAGAEIFSRSKISDNKRQVTTPPSTSGGHGIRIENRSLVNINDTLINNNEDTGLNIRTNSTVNVKNVELINNRRHGVSVRNSVVNISNNSRINGNSQAGILANDQSTVSVKDSDVNDNDRSGISADNSSLTVEKSEFLNNKWRAIYVRNNGSLAVKGSAFRNNCTDQQADAVINLLNDSTGTVGPDNLIENNKSTGIEIHNCPGLVIIEKNTIKNNEADSNGGGILVWDQKRSPNGTNPEIRMNKIINNTAFASGGGIAILNARAVIKPDLTTNDRILIKDNKTTDGSGAGIAILNPAGKVRIEKTTIDHNESLSNNPARARGGGIQVYNDISLTVTPGAEKVFISNDNIIINNTALRGGGIAVLNAEVEIGGDPQSNKGNTIQNNTARHKEKLGTPNLMGVGGGIYISNPNLNLGNIVRGNIISQNKGTGIHLKGGGKHKIMANRIGFDGNTPQNEGHGIAIVDSHENIIGPDSPPPFGKITQPFPDGNIIFYHENIGATAASGVYIDTNSKKNKITRNSISKNRDKGIHLDGNANDRLSAPIFLDISPKQMLGMVSAAALQNSIVEIYEDSNNEGEKIRAIAKVRANRTFILPSNYGVKAQTATVTVTDLQGNTSEFGSGVLDIDLEGIPDADEMNSPGRVIGVNDDDDGIPAGPDNNNDVIDSDAANPVDPLATDKADMAVLLIGRLPLYLNGGTLALSVSSNIAGNPIGLRIFDHRDVQIVGNPPAFGHDYSFPAAHDVYASWADINTNSHLKFHAEGIVPGEYRIRLTYSDKNGVEIGYDEVIVNVIRADLDIVGINENDEETIGGLVVRRFDGNNAPRSRIRINRVEPHTWVGDVILTRNNDRVRVFTAAAGGAEMTFNGADNKFKNAAIPAGGIILFVEGFNHSGAMRDVTLQLEADGIPHYRESVNYTVLWVERPNVVFAGTISADNARNVAYTNWTVAAEPGLGNLGGPQLYNATFGERMGMGSEARARVNPPGFDYPGNNLMLERDVEFGDYIGDVLFADRAYSAAIPPANDTGPVPARDDNPDPNGIIYDWDAAGLAIPNAPVGQIRRTRNNFRVFASITVEGVKVRCSPVREYFIRFSMRQADAPNGTNWVPFVPPGIPDDNRAGNGRTRLTWDLR